MTDARISRRRFIELAGVGVAAVACGGAPAAASPSAAATAATSAATAAPATAAATPLGKAEKTALKIGNRLPSYNFMAPWVVAKDKGFFTDEGFTSIEIVQTEQVREGLVGGAVDFARIETLDIADAATKNVPMKLLAGASNYSAVIIAVRPEIKTVKDLEGKDILLGGTPGSKDYDERAAFLKAAGWDLSTVHTNAVTAPGGSDAWVKLMRDGKIAMTPAFNRHKPGLIADKYLLVVDSYQFGSDSMAAMQGFIDKNPNTVVRFLRGWIKASLFLKDNANKAYVLGLIEKSGIPVTQAIKDAYELDMSNFRPFDGGFDMTEMNAWVKKNFPTNAPEVKAFFQGAPLAQAQLSLGLPVDPK